MSLGANHSYDNDFHLYRIYFHMNGFALKVILTQAKSNWEMAYLELMNTASNLDIGSRNIVNAGKWLGDQAKFFVVCFCWLFQGLTLQKKPGKMQGGYAAHAYN